MATGEWAYGSFAECCPGDCYIGKIGAVEGRHVHFEGELCETNTLGQYTGTLDTHGLEIFEGDIVRWQAMGRTYTKVVEWIENRACFRPDFLGDTTGEWGGPVEIIGNVHDHPELIHDA